MLLFKPYFNAFKKKKIRMIIRRRNTDKSWSCWSSSHQVVMVSIPAEGLIKMSHHIAITMQSQISIMVLYTRWLLWNCFSSMPSINNHNLYLISPTIDLAKVFFKSPTHSHFSLSVYKIVNITSPVLPVLGTSSLSGNSLQFLYVGIKGMEHVPNIFMSFDKYLFLEVINILI